MAMQELVTRSVLLAFFALLANELAAQLPCARVWQPGQQLAGVDGRVDRAVLWDPDGAGPQTEQVVVAGTFTTAGAVAATKLAVYDPTLRMWSALLGAPVGDVRALASDATGRLFAEFGTGQVMQWTGAGWQAFAVPLPTTVLALAVLPNGDLVAGGTFVLPGGPTVGNAIARWDGVAWQPMGVVAMSFALGNVVRLVLLPNGDLLATGFFSSIGGVVCNNVARWDGVTWNALGAGVTAGAFGLLATANGDVLVASNFPGVSGVSVGRFDGTTWTLVPGTSNGQLLAPYGADGALIGTPTGLWLHQSSGLTLFAPWNGASPNCGAVLPGGDVLVAGSFANAAGTPAANAARWNGNAWSAASPGAAGVVAAMTTDRDGAVLAVGEFTGFPGTAATRMARFDGTAWTPLSLPAKATLVAARPNGELVVAGDFVAPGGAIARLAAWNNGLLTPINPGTWGNSVPRPLAVKANGEVLVVVSDTGSLLSAVARWNGTNLIGLPIALLGGVEAVCELDGGDLLFGGLFVSSSATSLLRWNGSQLTPVPGAPTSVTALARARNGDVFVGGLFAASGQRLARWNGSTWQPLGTGYLGSVRKIVELPDGSLALAERSLTTPFTSRVLLWDGASLHVLATMPGEAAIEWSEAGELLVGGSFLQIASLPLAVLARLGTACPAGVVDRGGGCAGAAGPIVQVVERRAWLGGQLRVRTHGIANGGLAAAVFGFTPISLPLPLVHPLGTAGCTLLAADDIVMTLGVQAGEALAPFVVPTAAVLLGASFEQQTVVCETTASGDLAALFTSNALSLTIGSW